MDAEKIRVPLLLPTPHQPGQPICRTNKNTRPQMGPQGTTEPKEDKRTFKSGSRFVGFRLGQLNMTEHLPVRLDMLDILTLDTQSR